MNPLISIIVPVYNSSGYIKRCLDSCLCQTHTNLEIIVVDDGSSDTSPQLCDQYAIQDSRVKVIHQKNNGVCVARNTGLDVATGDYIGFVDIDDWAEPDMFEYLLDLCITHQADVSVCEYYDPRHTPLFKQTHTFSAREWLALPNAISVVWAQLFAKTVLKNVRFVPGITMAEDHLFSTQAVLNAHKIAYGPAPKYHYEINASSATQQAFKPSKLTFFQAVALEQEAVSNCPWPEVHRRFQQAEIAGAVRLLRQIMQSNYQGKPEIQTLLAVLHKHKWSFLFSRAKLINKLFVLMCCINFNLTTKLYRWFVR